MFFYPPPSPPPPQIPRPLFYLERLDVENVLSSYFGSKWNAANVFVSLLENRVDRQIQEQKVLSDLFDWLSSEVCLNFAVSLQVQEVDITRRTWKQPMMTSTFYNETELICQKC